MKNIALVVVSFLFTQIVNAHGENKLGPHKGYIRMPGSFHTEVVMNGKSQIKVYLIDIEWKNPSVNKSSLEVEVVSTKNTVKAECKITQDHYSCSFPTTLNLYRKAELKVNAKREGVQGSEAKYVLPLQIDKNPNDEYNMHTEKH